jgi:hypothetical protein
VRRVPISCFVLPDSFSTVTSASGPVFLFCAPGIVFGGTKGVGSRFHVLRARTHFRRYRGRRVSFLCFALPDSFWAVPRASLPVVMFFGAGHVFGGTEGIRSRFHVLHTRIRFRRNLGRQFPFSCFARPNSISAVPRASLPIFMFWATPRASGPIFLFCAPGHVFCGTRGVGSRFLVLRARTHFRRYRGRQIPFSCFARPDSFSAVPRASCLVFMFCAP